MIERRDGTGFALEAVAVAFGGDFYGDAASEARIDGGVDDSHAAGAEAGFDTIGAELFACSEFGGLFTACRRLPRWTIEQGFTRGVVGKEGLHLALEFQVRAAGLLEKGGRLAAALVAGGMVQRFD